MEESRDCWTDCRRQAWSCEGPFRTSGLEGDDSGEDDHVLLRTALPALPSDPVPSRASTLLPMIPFMSCACTTNLPPPHEKSSIRSRHWPQPTPHLLTLRLSLSTSSTDPRTFTPEPTSSRRSSPSPTRSSWTSSAPDASKSRKLCSVESIGSRIKTHGVCWRVRMDTERTRG